TLIPRIGLVGLERCWRPFPSQYLSTAVPVEKAPKPPYSWVCRDICDLKYNRQSPCCMEPSHLVSQSKHPNRAGRSNCFDSAAGRDRMPCQEADHACAIHKCGGFY